MTFGHGYDAALVQDSSSYPIERSIYIANILSGILYSVLVCMVFQSYHLLKSFNRETPGKRTFYILYSFTQLLLVTVEFALNALAGQLMWIDYRNFHGGPFAYYMMISGSWQGIGVISCGVLTIGMADGLLLYRCYTVWGADLRVIILPLLLYIAELAMGIAVPIEVARSHTSFLSKPSTNFSIPWISLECSLTTLLTLLIAGRILYVSHGLQAEKVNLNTNYARVIAIIVEPALPLSLSGIVFAVCVARSLSPTVPFANIWGMLAAIAPQSIILRVAMGRAWTEIAANRQTTAIQFANIDNMALTSQA